MAKDELGTNKDNMYDPVDDEYITTLVVGNRMVNVFINDPGQCCWFQWLNEDNQLESMSCGTYNMNYEEEIEDFFRNY